MRIYLILMVPACLAATIIGCSQAKQPSTRNPDANRQVTKNKDRGTNRDLDSASSDRTSGGEKNPSGGDEQADSATPPPPLGEFALNALPNTNSYADISWQASTNAQSYRVAISEKEDCSDPLYETTVTDPQVSIKDKVPLNRTLYACVTATNGSELSATNSRASLMLLGGTYTLPKEGAPTPASYSAIGTTRNSVRVQGGSVNGTDSTQDVVLDVLKLKWGGIDSVQLDSNNFFDYSYALLTRRVVFVSGFITVLRDRLLPPNAASVELANDNAFPARMGHAQVMTSAGLLSVGGMRNNAGQATIGLHHPIDRVWTVLTNPLNKTRNRGNVAASSKVALVFGGDDCTATIAATCAATSFFQDPLLFDIPTKTLIAAETTGQPSPRTLPFVLAVGEKFYVYGGLSGNGTATTTLSTGAVYDSVAKKWTPMANGPALKSQPIVYVPANPNVLTVAGVVKNDLHFIEFDGTTATHHRYETAKDVWTKTAIPDLPATNDWIVAKFVAEKFIFWGSARLVGNTLQSSDGGYVYVP